MSNITFLNPKDTQSRDLPVKGFDGNKNATLTGFLTDEAEALTGNDAALTLSQQLIQATLNTSENLTILRTEHTPAETQLILNGAAELAQHIEYSKEVSVTTLINEVAKNNEQYSYRLLMDKCKPLLFEAGILIKLNAKKCAWVNLETAQNIVKTCNRPAIAAKAPANEKQKPAIAAKESVIATQYLQKLLDTWVIYRAKRNPYAQVQADGSIKKVRKCFTGELTEDEKKAIREAKERQAFEKLLGKGALLSEEAKTLAQQKQLEAIERKAAQQAMMDSFWIWAKILGFVALVIFAINSTGTGTPIDTGLPQGIQQ